MTNANKCDVCGKPKCDVSRETNECDFSEDGSFCHGHAAPAATGEKCVVCGRPRCTAQDECFDCRNGFQREHAAICHHPAPAAQAATGGEVATGKGINLGSVNGELAKHYPQDFFYRCSDVDRRWAEREREHEAERKQWSDLLDLYAEQKREKDAEIAALQPLAEIGRMAVRRRYSWSPDECAQLTEKLAKAMDTYRATQEPK